MIVYNSIRTLPLFIFDEIIRTKDLNLLGVENPEKIWNEILIEYDELTSGYESKKQYRDKIELLNLELKLKTLRNCFFLTQMNLTDEQKQAIELIKKNYGITDLKGAISSTETLLAIRKKEQKQTDNQKPKSIDWQVARASKFLGYRIDKFKISVSEWVETLQMIETQIKEQQKWQKK